VALGASLVWLVAVFAPGTVSAAPVSAKAAIQAAYDAQDTALGAQDVDGAMAPYAEEAIFIDDIPGAKRQGLEHQGLAAVRQGFVNLFNLPNQTVTSASHEVKETTFSKTNTGATLLILLHINLTGTTKAGRMYQLRLDEQVRHFWAKTGDGWRIKQERLLSIDSYINGKLSRHNHLPVSQ